MLMSPWPRAGQPLPTTSPTAPGVQGAHCVTLPICDTQLALTQEAENSSGKKYVIHFTKHRTSSGGNHSEALARLQDSAVLPEYSRYEWDVYPVSRQ